MLLSKVRNRKYISQTLTGEYSVLVNSSKVFLLAFLIDLIFGIEKQKCISQAAGSDTNASDGLQEMTFIW